MAYTIKQGADISKLNERLLKMLDTLALAWQACFPEDADGLTVTSGHETSEPLVHSAKSKHYLHNNDDGTGRAVDIRLNDVPQWKATMFCSVAFIVIGMAHGFQGFRIFAEGILTARAHLHLELTP